MNRYPRGYSRMNGQGRIRDVVHISERPAEAKDRAVPGHWEGDLVYGSANSCMATLVERQTRFLMLVKIPGRHTSTEVMRALTDHVQSLPTELFRSLTWDQGKEMALHQQFTIDTGVQIYFCDPKSPWQRGSNENTNGCVSTSPRVEASPVSLRTTSTRSPPDSTDALDRPRLHDTVTGPGAGVALTS